MVYSNNHNNLKFFFLFLKEYIEIKQCSDLLLTQLFCRKISTNFFYIFSKTKIYFFRILSLNLKDLDPDSVVKNKKFPSDFSVEVKFKELCKCTSKTVFSEKCSQCLADLQDEESNWTQIYKIMSVYFFFFC